MKFITLILILLTHQALAKIPPTLFPKVIYGNDDRLAVIKLDRPVTGRTPLQFRQHGKPANDATFTVIGHPSGLPTKIASSAQMRSNTDPIFFTINSDTYSKNSGSAVVDSKTGIVEGILVRGDVDYVSTKEGCLVSVNHPEDGGTGEGVTRITVIRDLSK